MLTKAEIKFIRSLSDRSARRESGLFAVEGLKSVGELLSSDFEVERVLATPQCALRLQDDRTQVISPAEMERLSMQRTPQGCMALAALPRYEFDPQAFGDALALALDDVQDPANVGAIVRTAAWFGVRDVLCSLSTADLFGPKAIQASMGAFLRVRIHCGDLPRMLKDATRCRAQTWGTFLEGENLYSAPLRPTGIVVLGNEGSGISASTARAVNRRISIPAFAPAEAEHGQRAGTIPADAKSAAAMRGAESLNVAAAAAVVCSEFRRRSL